MKCPLFYLDDFSFPLSPSWTWNSVMRCRLPKGTIIGRRNGHYSESEIANLLIARSRAP
jgi:hypothetical protein